MRAVPRMHLGNYEPLLQLATGGMATVYVARQIGAGGFERLVVLKRVHAHLLANREFYDMFRDEARLAAMLHHPNVVPVTDVVEADGELFLVMEYVESVSLSTLLKAAYDKGARLPPAVVSRVMVDALSGLHAAHEAFDMRGQRLEIVHRDVSPQNVIVGVDGASRLIDFGVAKARHRLTETRSGSLKGKYSYMSPEQAKAQPVDRRADLFSAGIVLWEALTSVRLFRADTELETIRRITEAPIPPPSSIAPEVSPALDALVLRSLERDRDKRLQSAAEFIEALETTCFPAPAREAAAVVKAYCSERIDGRRVTLQGMLDGRIEPLSATLIALTDDGEVAPSRSVPASRRRGPDDEGTEGKIAATHDAPAPRRRSAKALLAGGSAVVAGGLLVAAIVFGIHHRTSMAEAQRPVPNASSSASTSISASVSPSTSAVASTPSVASAISRDVAADEVVLQVVANAPIERVSAPGIHSAKVDGKRARMVVARWGGELMIDAVLAGGTTARGVATSDGPREISLTTAARAGRDAGSTVSAPMPPPRPVVNVVHPPPTTDPGLHANPYAP